MSTHVEAVLSDVAMLVRAYAAGPGTVSIFPWIRVPNILKNPLFNVHPQVPPI